jgi:hypothetical protein
MTTILLTEKGTGNAQDQLSVSFLKGKRAPAWLEGGYAEQTKR